MILFPSVSHLLTHECDRAGESKKGSGTRNTDTDACGGGSTAGLVNILCQPSNLESDPHLNDSSQFDQTVVNSDCDKPVDETNADTVEGGALCGTEENEVLVKTNSGAAKLATVDDTRPPDDSFTGGKSSWWRGQRARLIQKRHHQHVRGRGRERDWLAPDIGATAEQTSSTIPGQRRRKLESGSHRAGGASGQGSQKQYLPEWNELLHRVNVTVDQARAHKGNDLDSIIVKHFERLFFEWGQPTR